MIECKLVHCLAKFALQYFILPFFSSGHVFCVIRFYHRQAGLLGSTPGSPCHVSFDVLALKIDFPSSTLQSENDSRDSSEQERLLKFPLVLLLGHDPSCAGKVLHAEAQTHGEREIERERGGGERERERKREKESSSSSSSSSSIELEIVV